MNYNKPKLPLRDNLLKHTYCYVCTKGNKQGLKVDFKKKKDKMVGIFVPKREHQSYEGITHGGILATLLDAAMNRAIMAQGLVAFTGKLEVRFLKNAPIGVSLKIIGEVNKRRKTSILGSGFICLPDNSCVAIAKGIFILK